MYYAPEEGGGGYGAYSAAVGVGGGGGESATSGNDVLYSSGSLVAVGIQNMSPTDQSFDLQAGDDVIGGPTADLAMNDSIQGGPGNDTIYAGSGNDWVWGDDDNDTLYGGSGEDIILGNEGSDVIYGGPNQDVLFGGGTTLDLATINAFDGSSFYEISAAPDTFVFFKNEGGSMANMDEIKGWTDGTDKIAFSSDGGNTYRANPFSDNAYGAGQHSLVDQYNGGMDVTMVYAGDMSETYFGVQGNVTFDDTDVTVAV